MLIFTFLVGLHVSQDSYVMEMNVQQEEWAKQKETKINREDRSGLGKRQRDINIYSLIGKHLQLLYWLNVWKMVAVKNKSRSVSSPIDSCCQTLHGVCWYGILFKWNDT